MRTHTPGPWVWKEEVDDDMPILFGANNTSICNFGQSTRYYPCEGTAPDEANARLIAAAPELLAALLDMIESYEHEGSSENPSLLAARATIVKATGSAS